MQQCLLMTSSTASEEVSVSSYWEMKARYRHLFLDSIQKHPHSRGHNKRKVRHIYTGKYYFLLSASHSELNSVRTMSCHIFKLREITWDCIYESGCFSGYSSKAKDTTSSPCIMILTSMASLWETSGINDAKFEATACTYRLFNKWYIIHNPPKLSPLCGGGTRWAMPAVV
jgi:hypothetical protein